VSVQDFALRVTLFVGRHDAELRLRSHFLRDHRSARKSAASVISIPTLRDPDHHAARAKSAPEQAARGLANSPEQHFQTRTTTKKEEGL